MTSPALEEFLNGAPRWRRPGMRALIALATRPRGLALLERLAPADQAATALIRLVAYDDPSISTSLGWDAERVAERGRSLRHAEHRP
ncbi:MAG: hypothetical protein ACJ76X_06785 [Solirubrobacteraceae bacterium]|jgi:hypothetical protein